MYCLQNTSNTVPIEKSEVSDETTCPYLFPVIVGALAAATGILALIAYHYPHTLGPLNSLGRLGQPASFCLIAGGAIPIIVVVFLPAKKVAPTLETATEPMSVAESSEEAPAVEEPDDDARDMQTMLDEITKPSPAIRMNLRYDKTLERINKKFFDSELRSSVSLLSKTINSYFDSRELPPLALFENVQEWELNLLRENFAKVAEAKDINYMAEIVEHLAFLACPSCSNGKVLPVQDMTKILMLFQNIPFDPAFVLDTIKAATLLIFKTLRTGPNLSQHEMVIDKDRVFDHVHNMGHVMLAPFAEATREAVFAFPGADKVVKREWVNGVVKHRPIEICRQNVKVFASLVMDYFNKRQVFPFAEMSNTTDEELIVIRACVQQMVKTKETQFLVELFLSLAQIGCPTCSHEKELPSPDRTRLTAAFTQALKPYDFNFIRGLIAAAVQTTIAGVNAKQPTKDAQYGKVVAREAGHFIIMTRMIVGGMSEVERKALLSHTNMESIMLGAGWTVQLPKEKITLDDVFVPHAASAN